MDARRAALGFADDAEMQAALQRRAMVEEAFELREAGVDPNTVSDALVLGLKGEEGFTLRDAALFALSVAPVTGNAMAAHASVEAGQTLLDAIDAEDWDTAQEAGIALGIEIFGLLPGIGGALSKAAKAAKAAGKASEAGASLLTRSIENVRGRWKATQDVEDMWVTELKMGQHAETDATFRQETAGLSDKQRALKARDLVTTTESDVLLPPDKLDDWVRKNHPGLTKDQIKQKVEFLQSGLDVAFRRGLGKAFESEVIRDLRKLGLDVETSGRITRVKIGPADTNRFYDALSSFGMDAVDGRLVRKHLDEDRAIVFEIKLGASESETQRGLDATIQSGTPVPNALNTVDVENVIWLRGGIGNLSDDAFQRAVDDVIARNYGSHTPAEQAFVRQQMLDVHTAAKVDDPEIPKEFFFKITGEQIAAFIRGEAKPH